MGKHYVCDKHKTKGNTGKCPFCYPDHIADATENVQPDRCPHCGYTPGVIPSGSALYAQANCEHRESHAEHALRAPAALSLNRRQRRCIRNAAERFDSLGYAFGAELRECFPEAFASLGKGRM